jgi:RNA polymerase sigma-70 factor (ECF subfamily)
MSVGWPMPLRANDLCVALPRLRRYARLLTDDPRRADDLVAMTLARARRPTFRSPPGRTPESGLLALLRAIFVEQFANPQEVRPLPYDRRPLDAASDANPSSTEDTLARLFCLPLEQREVLVLVAVERMSYDEVATLLAMPVATVLTRLARAREALRVHDVDRRTNPRTIG